MPELNGQFLLNAGILCIDNLYVESLQTTAVGGKGYFAYIVDTSVAGQQSGAAIDESFDSTATNNPDFAGRKLFIGVYDFAAGQMGDSVRITNDSVDDSFPQLVKNGAGVYLFAVHGGALSYTGLGFELLCDILNGGNKICDGENGNRLMSEIVAYDPFDGKAQTIKPTDYSIYRGTGGELYAVWSERYGGSEGVELFASIMTVKNGTETWSNKRLLTDNGYDIAEHSLLVDGNGTMYIVHNTSELDDDNNEINSLKMNTLITAV